MILDNNKTEPGKLDNATSSCAKDSIISEKHTKPLGLSSKILKYKRHLTGQLLKLNLLIKFLTFKKLFQNLSLSKNLNLLKMITLKNHYPKFNKSNHLSPNLLA